MSRALRLAAGAALLWAAGCVEPGDGARPPAEGAPLAGADAGGAGADLGVGGQADGGGGPAAAEQVCALWRQERTFRDEGAWTGSDAGCVPGEYRSPGPDNTLRQVNLYRALAGLGPVGLDAGKSAVAQACALIMHANGDIKHQVPETWSCWTAAGSEAATRSNLATTPAVFAVDMYMLDAGIPTLGHRRWILSDDIGPIGVGSTSDYSCLHVIPPGGARPEGGAAWTAWPSPGPFPWEAVTAVPWEGPDALDWHVQSDTLDVSAATVTMRADGQALPVQAGPLEPYYGSLFGIAWRPVGWTIAPGTTYEVELSGLAEPITYTVTVVACEGG